MSTITHLYAGVPVSDLDASVHWYARFLDRPPDFRAGDEVLWEITEGATLFIEPNVAQAGVGRITFSVAGLDELLERLTARGIQHEPVETYSNGVRHAKVPDPDGNAIALAEPPDLTGSTPTASIQPELWVENPREAVAFYEAAFGATILHRVGDGDDIVAQLGVGSAAFWVAGTSATLKRLSPRAIDGATSRTLLVVEDPERVVRHAIAAGATESSPVNAEHGWRLGRIVDPFGHEWEIGVPMGDWPPS